ncbi:MAG: RluA family pseudouridine synthase [Bdellovibrionota bacterium]
MNIERELPSDFRALGKEIEHKDCGRRLDEFLAEQFPFLTRSSWKKRIKNDEVLINRKAVRAAYRLRVDDSICYFHPQVSEPEVDRKIEVLWEQDGIIAVYKPSNLPMHEGGRYFKNTFSEVIREKLGHEWAAVHRLDRETSGIVLCAGTPELRAKLSEEFRHRVMKKVYIAFVRGIPTNDQWSVNEKIGDYPHSSFRLKKWVVQDGLPSQTFFEVVEKTNSHCYLRVLPLTGRTHQIRIHAAWYGLPLVGEKKYYPDESVFLEYMDHGLTERVLRLTEADRLCLHAACLSFLHPVTEKLVELECPVPEDMQSIWKQLADS